MHVYLQLDCAALWREAAPDMVLAQLNSRAHSCTLARPPTPRPYLSSAKG